MEAFDTSGSPPSGSFSSVAGARALQAADVLSSLIENEDEKASFLVDLAKALTDARQWQAAEAIARSENTFASSYNQERAIALTYLGQKLLFFDEEQRGLEILTRAAEGARGITINWQKAETLYNVARLLWRTPSREQAKALCMEAVQFAREGQQPEMPQDSADCVSVLREIAVGMAEAGEMQEAKEIAAQIVNAAARAQALEAIRAAEVGH